MWNYLPSNSGEVLCRDLKTSTVSGGQDVFILIFSLDYGSDLVSARTTA